MNKSLPFLNKSLPLLLRRAVLTMLVVNTAISLPPPAVAAQSRPRTMATARLKLTLTGHTKSIIEIVFSPDGETIATGSEDGTVRLWSASDGRERAALKLTKKKPHTLLLVWSPDSQQLATCWYSGFGNSREANVWDARTGALLATLAGHRASLNHVEWSPDGRTILTASDDGTAKLWDGAGTRALRRTIQYQKVDVSRETDSILAAVFTRKKISDPRGILARFAAGGRTVVISSNNELPQLWSVDGELIAPLFTQSERIIQSNISYPSHVPPLISPDGRTIATDERDGTHLWDARTGAARHTLPEQNVHVFSPDGRTLITACLEAEPDAGFFDLGRVVLKLWDVETGALQKVWREAVHSVNRIYSSPGGSWKSLVVVGAGSKKARVIDAETGTLKGKLPFDSCTESLFSVSGCEPFIFSADGRITLRLAGGALKLFDAGTGQQFAVLDDTHRRAAFSPVDAHLLAARSKDKKSLMLFEVAAR